MASTLEPGGGTGVDGLEAMRRQNYEVLLDRLARTRPLAGLRVLEVGSAWGWFIEAVGARGAFAQGIEPERVNVDLYRERGLGVQHGFFPDDLADRGPYDLIVFNDVFEQLPDPAAAGAAVESLLRPGGLVVVNLPSNRGALFRLASLLERLGVAGFYERLW